eukprot:m.413655 g.413655  ORF g.413655 m.413655 type:complete len:283 (-) comp29144_c0_seq1:206-1054(-)
MEPQDRQYKHTYPAVPEVRAPTPHKCRRFEGKVVVMTACTKGLAYASAIRFAEEGAKLVISSRKQEAVDEAIAPLVARGFEVSGVACHQAKAADRARLIKFAVDKYGKIDVCVLCVGIQPGPATGPTLSVPSEMFEKLFETNVKSFWEFVKDVKPHLNTRASFLFVSSNAAYNPVAPLGLYGVSKTSLIGLTKLLAHELGPEGIRVNCLAPGLVRTRFSELLWKGKNGDDGIFMKSIENGTYLRRAAEPYEMAGAMCFACSDDASYMTGEVMLVHGGGSARL